MSPLLQALRVAGSAAERLAVAVHVRAIKDSEEARPSSPTLEGVLRRAQDHERRAKVWR